MKHYVGLDMSQKETSVCVVDDAGHCWCEFRAKWSPLHDIRSLAYSNRRLADHRSEVETLV